MRAFDPARDPLPRAVEPCTAKEGDPVIFGRPVIDADSHKCENPVVFLDHVPPPFRERISLSSSAEIPSWAAAAKSGSSSGWDS